MSPVPTPQTSVFDIRDLLWRVRRHKWVGVLALVCAVCVATTYLQVRVPVYESSVVVATHDRGAVTSGVEALVREERIRENQRERVANITTRIKNRKFLERLVQRVGLARDPEILLLASQASAQKPGTTPEESATRMSISMVSKALTVVGAGSNHIQITTTDRRPKRARDIAQAVADELIEDTKQARVGRAQARGEFSAEQIYIYQEKLKQAEEALRAYQESSLGRSLTSAPRTPEALSSVAALVRNTDQEIDIIRERIRSDMEEWSRTVGPETALPDLKSRRASELESQLSTLEGKYGTASAQSAGPEDQNKTQLHIGSVRQALLAEMENIATLLPGDFPERARFLAAGITSDRAQIRSLQERRRRLTKIIGETSQRVYAAPREQLEMTRLQREVQSYRDLLGALQREATSSRMTEAMQSTELSLRLEIIQTPELPTEPAGPPPMQVLVAALGIGFALGTAGIYLMDRLGTAVATVEQVEREMGARVIGTVPRIEGWPRPGSYVKRNWAVLSIGLVLLATGVFYAIHTSLQSNHTSETSSHGPLP